MNLIARSAPLFRSAAVAQPIMRSSVRTIFWLRKTPKAEEPMPEKEIRVTFEVDKLFKKKQLNQEYVTGRILESLKEKVPSSLVVRKDANDKNSATATVNQPSTSSSSDWIVYYLMYQSFINSNSMQHTTEQHYHHYHDAPQDNHHQSPQISYQHAPSPKEEHHDKRPDESNSSSANDYDSSSDSDPSSD